MALQNDLPHNIRLIAAISRLIDFHQSRRDNGGYVPDIPDKAGVNLHLALSIINVLHEVELERGDGYCPVGELVRLVKVSLPEASSQDIEIAVDNLRQGREIHYGFVNESGEAAYARTWDTTPLLDAQGGMSQIRLSENARLFLRVSSLHESWLYSDLDADRLVKALERGQFQDIPIFCRSMKLDLAAKSKQLTGALERPSLVEMRSMLVTEGAQIAEALNSAAIIINKAIEWVYSPIIIESFDAWAVRHKPGYHLGNLQAELDLVLQSVEALSRQFLRFLGLAQQVKNDGIQPIHFLGIANNLVLHGSEKDIDKAETLLSVTLPAGVNLHIFQPDFLTGEADIKPPKEKEARQDKAVMIDPTKSSASSRFMDFVLRNRGVLIETLKDGPLRFSKMMEITGFQLEPDETALDFFGLYATPNMVSSKAETIIVGFTGEDARFFHDGYDVLSSDPFIALVPPHDPL